MDLVKQDNYDQMSAQIRFYCAQKLITLEAALVGYVNGELGDPQPGHLQAYVSILKELGRLYGVQQRPRDPEDMIPARKVEELILQERERGARELAEAVACARIEALRELETKAAKSLESAKSQVLGKLQGLG